MKEIKEAYKMTELGEIPKLWDIVQLKDVLILLKDGTHNPPKRTEVGIPMLNAENIFNGKINYGLNEKFISNKDYSEMHKNYEIKKGDILMTIVGTIGRVAIVEDERKFTVQRSVAILKNKKNIKNYYLAYFLSSNLCKKELDKKSNSTAQAGLYLGELGKIKVILPSYHEQEKIVSILSTVDEQIDNTEKLIQKNQELKKGLMQQLLTKGIGHTEFKKTEMGEIPKAWEVVNFDDIIDLLTDYEANGSFSSIKENVRIYDEINYAYFVRATDLEKKNYINSIKYVDEESYKFLRKTELKGGELLITKRGQIGKVYLMPYLNKKCTLAPNLYLIKLKNDKVKNIYMYYYFISNKGQKSLISNVASTTLGALYKDDLKKIKILLPSMEEQIKISKILLSIDDIIRQQQYKKEKLEEIKKGLMQQLLTGKIKVI